MAAIRPGFFSSNALTKTYRYELSAKGKVDHKPRYFHVFSMNGVFKYRETLHSLNAQVRFVLSLADSSHW